MDLDHFNLLLHSQCKVRLHASLHETISEINVTEIVMRSTVRRDELDLLPALPLLAKNISDSGMPAEGAAPLMAPRLMRFVSDQGTDRGPVPEAVSSRYLPVVLASGCGEAWRIALRMQDWSVPLHKDVQSFEINAKLNFTFESGFSMSVFMTMDYCVDRYARGRTCTAFCSISSKSVAGESVYCQLLQPIISDMHTMTLAALSDAHSSLLTYVVDLASSLSAAMEVEGALAAISLALQRPQQRSSLSADFSLKILVMIGQLVEIFFRSRKDEYQTHVSAAESFRRKPQLLRRCQVLCGALGAGLWDTIEVLDKNLLKNFAQSNDFAVSRLLRMGVMFLFHGDVNSIVPCFRAITSPALFNEFSSGASVAHNAYDVVFHDWHLGLRMKSINKSVDRVVKLFAPYNSLLLSNRNAFSVEAITCLQSFRQVLVDFRRILETVNMLTERWDYEFADSFTSDDSFGHPMKSGDLCKDLQALKQPSDGSSRVRKAYVEAQYASSKLFEAFGLTLRVRQN